MLITPRIKYEHIIVYPNRSTEMRGSIVRQKKLNGHHDILSRDCFQLLNMKRGNHYMRTKTDLACLA